MSKPERKKSAGQNTGDEQPTRERTEGMRERDDGKSGEERMEKEWERRDKTTKRQRDNTKRREKEKVKGGKREIVRESKASVRYRALMLKHIGQPPGWHAGDTIRLVGAKSLVISILMLTSCATWGQPPRSEWKVRQLTKRMDRTGPKCRK